MRQGGRRRKMNKFEEFTTEQLIEELKRREEERQRFLDDYYDNPLVHEGWAQQDMIDMRRRER